MVAFLFLLFTLAGLLLVNYRTAEKIAPTDRLGLSLVLLGIGSAPFSVVLLLVPTVVLLTVGVCVFAFVPTGNFYRRRNERRLRLSTLRNIPIEVRNPNGVPHGLCPNCEALIPIASLECPECSASFDGPGEWKVESI
jgi:hypothetical protein